MENEIKIFGFVRLDVFDVFDSDDCTGKIWDIRNSAGGPLRVLADHSHWVWCVKYNPFHDQLLLTSSSDSRVILTSIASLSSEPITRDTEDEPSSDPDGKEKFVKIKNSHILRG